jgi:hypothetical protein
MTLSARFLADAESAARPERIAECITEPEIRAFILTSE